MRVAPMAGKKPKSQSGNRMRNRREFMAWRGQEVGVRESTGGMRDGRICAADDALHAVLDGQIEVVFQPSFDFATQSGDARLHGMRTMRGPLLQAVKPVIQRADTHGDAEDVIAQLIDLGRQIMSG